MGVDLCTYRARIGCFRNPAFHPLCCWQSCLLVWMVISQLMLKLAGDVEENPGPRQQNISKAKLSSFKNKVKPKEWDMMEKKTFLTLDLSDKNLTQLPEEVFELKELEALDLTHNENIDLSDQLTKLTNLKVLGLANCNLATVPAAVMKLPQLEMLILSNNEKITLPDELAELTSIRVLKLERTGMDTIPPVVWRLAQLEWLDLNLNHLQTLPAEIGHFTNAKLLDLSGCELRTLPPEVGRLTQLEWLDLSNNQLQTLPAEIGLMNDLYYIDVSHNPLIKPPAEVCRHGIAAIKQYFEELGRSEEKTSTHMKVVVLGEKMAGKTSLVQTLNSGKSTLTEEEDRTHCVEITQWAPDGNITFEVYDFGGHDVYHLTHQFFLTPDAFHLLLVNLQEYSCTEESYKKHVGFWLDTLNARVPGAVVSIVGSKKDMCSSEAEINGKVKDIEKKFQRQMDTWKSNTERQIRELNKRSEEAKSDEEQREIKQQLERAQSLLDKPMRLTNKHMHCISSAEPTSGLDSLKNHILESTNDTSLFPTLRKILPQTWVKFEQKMLELRDKGTENPEITSGDGDDSSTDGDDSSTDGDDSSSDNEDLSTLHLQSDNKPKWLTQNDCLRLGQLAGFTADSLEPVLFHLQQVGTILRYTDIPELKDLVFHDPPALIEIFKDLYHHDIEALFSTPRVKKEYTSGKRRNFEHDLCKRGLIRKDVMTCLLPSDINPDIVTALMQHFGLCFEIIIQDKTDPSKHTCWYRVPWYLQEEMPQNWKSVWPDDVPEDQEQLQLMCNITGFCPRGLFQRFSVGIHPLVKDRVDWKDGVMAYRQDYPVLVCSKPVADDTYITMATRGRLAQAGEMWGVVHPLLEVLVQLLQEWPGVLYSPHVTCAHCIKAGLDRPYQHELRGRTAEDGRDVRCPRVKKTASTSADLVYRPARLSVVGRGSSQTRVKQSQQENDCYKMTSDPRGVALIISNTDFTDPTRNRPGGAKDLENLRKICGKLKLQQEIKQNLTAQQIEAVTKDVSKRDHSSYDCFVLFLLSHGTETGVLGTDGQHVSVDSIISSFQACKSLVGKPKLFFILACRGGDRDTGLADTATDGASSTSQTRTEASDGSTEATASPPPPTITWVTPVESPDAGETLPTASDRLVMYATVHGHVSWRNSNTGTWLVQALADVITEHADMKELHDMLMMVNAKVADFKTQTQEQEYKQQPEVTHTLRKKLYFFPSRLSGVPLEIQLRGSRMQQLYSEACREGAQPVYSVRGLVVGQFRAGKTSIIRRLTGEKAVKDQPITDGIEISPSVMTKTWQKTKEEPDEFKESMAERLAKQQQHEERKKSRITNRKNRTGSSFQDVEKTEDQQEDPLKDQAPTQSQQTPKPEDKSKTTSPQQQTQDVRVHKKTQDIPDDVIMKAKTRLQGDVRVHQNTQDIPDDVIIKAKERLQSGVSEEQLGTAEHPRISLWDFGGQAAYYGSHQCFFTYRGIYILVMSLLQKLSDQVPDLDYKAAADNLVTGRDYLDHWLNSVHTHGLVPGREREPRVVLVLTHKDEVNESDIEMYKKDIHDHIHGMDAGKHVLPKIFVIDNFSEDNSDIDELREYLREVAKGLWFMGEKVPITWLHLKSKLMEKRRQGDQFCRFQDVVDLARSDVGITDDSHVAEILTFLHDLGDIIFINKPGFRDHVALRPQVMIDVFKTIITVPKYQQDRSTDGEVAEMWRRLENKGTLSDRLLTIIWTKADQKMQKPFLLEHKDFLKRLMEKYYLLCNATPIGGFDDTADEPEKEEIYFVPSLLAAKPDDSILYPGDMKRYQHPLYVEFKNMFLPSGMFYRLQAICVHRFGLEESHVFAGCGRFPTNDEKQQFVVTKKKHYLKVELLSAEAEDHPVFTQGLPVRKFLSSCLFEIKEKWIPYIQYDWCFGEESDEETETPEFYPLSDIGQETATGSSRFPEDFINVWMGSSSDKRTSRAENSGGSGPAMIEPKKEPEVVQEINPLLDCLEMFEGLSFEECEQIRNGSTPDKRFEELLDAVKNAGDMCRRLLGASAEVCLPEIAPMFSRQERGNEIVILHIDEYSDKLVQPLKGQASQYFSRYGVTVSEYAIEPGDNIKKKLLHHLLQRNVRMVVPIITEMSLENRYWPPLQYGLYVQNKKLVFPVLAYEYPEVTRESLLEKFTFRCEDMKDMSSPQIAMTTEPLSSTKISLTAAQILRKASYSVVLHTCKITAKGRTVEEDSVTISFPTGCVEMEKSLSLEVDILPIDEALTKTFSAVTPVLTVHQDKEEDFLQPVSVTLPWAWRKSDHSCSKDKTILIEGKSHSPKWSLLEAEVHETEDAVTFTMRNLCRVAAAKESGNGGESLTSIQENQDETSNREAADESIPREPNDQPASQSAVTTDAFQACWNMYTEDKVYLIVNPDKATKYNKIHLMCVHKDADPNSFDRPDNMLPLPPFRQRIVMGRDEKINATFDNSKDVIGDPDDVSSKGMRFVFPPAARRPPKCNRWSVKLIPKTPRPARKTHMYQGAINFHPSNEKDKTDPWRRILPAQVSLYSDEESSGQPQRPQEHNTSENYSKRLKGGKDEVKSTLGENSHQLDRSQDQDAPGNPAEESKVGKDKVAGTTAESPDQPQDHNASGNYPEKKVGKDKVAGTSEESSDQHQDYNASGNHPEDLEAGKSEESSHQLKRSQDQDAPKKLKRGKDEISVTSAGSDVSRYFRYVKNNATADWMDLGEELGLSWAEVITGIDKKHRDDKSRCRDMLAEWKKRKGEAATITVLMDALRKVKLMSVVDGLMNEFPELKVHDASGNHPAGPRLPVILLVNDEYGTSKGGISTINCQSSQTLKGKAVVYAIVLQLNVPTEDQEAADRDGVRLIQPVQLDKESVPSLNWLTYYHDRHFPNLPQDVTCIIGHADITDTAARNIKDQRYPQADLIMFTHVIPEDTDYYKGGRKAMKAWEKEKDMVDKVDKAKAAFSVGGRIFDHFDNLYRGGKKPQSHKIFLPKPSELFLDAKVTPGGRQKVVLSIGRVRKVEKLKGHDLVGESMRDVVKIIKNARWCVRGISEDDFEASQKILEDALNSPDLNPTLRSYGTQEDIRDDMMKAHLVLMPSRSEPFGLVGLEAITAGIPVLISNQTGLAELITDLIKKKKLSAEHRNIIVETSVNDSDRTGDVKRWADRIVDVLEFNDSEFEKAARLKRELVESRYWEESHNAFLQACGCSS